MTFDQWLQIASITFGIGGIGTFFLTMHRMRTQNSLDLSTAWEKFAAPLMERVAYLETRTQEQTKEINTLNDKVTDQETEIEDLRGWAERLSRQVISHGDTPEPFIRRKSKHDDQ